jgi:hypothetical protein
MEKRTVTREDILNALREALAPLDYTHAMWEGGAAAFDRIDEWSDIDLQVDTDDERVQDVFAVAEQALNALSPIELSYEIPQPTWHGHWQKFYRLSDASAYLLLDLTVITHSNPNKFIQPELHGNAVIHFDKANVVQSQPLDRATLADQLRARVETLRLTFDLFRILALKELNRHNDIEAIAFYHSWTLRPLIEALRIQYKPARHSFYTRYIHYDLPQDIVRELQDLFFVRDADDLRAKRERAERWFYETLEGIEIEPDRLDL